jgi:hypothetical protein
MGQYVAVWAGVFVHAHAFACVGEGGWIVSAARAEAGERALNLKTRGGYLCSSCVCKHSPVFNLVRARARACVHWNAIAHA